LVSFSVKGHPNETVLVCERYFEGIGTKSQRNPADENEKKPHRIDEAEVVPKLALASKALLTDLSLSPKYHDDQN